MATSGPLKWHGGKSYLAKRIRELMPKHTRYCETHFGGGAVLLSGDGEGVAEYANDKNYNLTHFWFVLGDAGIFPDFLRRAQCKPLSEVEFDAAQKRLESRMCMAGGGVFPRMPTDAAVDFFVVNRQSRQALGRDFATPTSRLRRNMNEQVSAWLSAVDGLPEFHQRLRRVEIRCQDALDFIKELDSPDTLFYVDPPYMHHTRVTTKEYGEFEMTRDQHDELLRCLSCIQGKFILSGYLSDLYENWQRAQEWQRVDIKIPNQASGKKTKEIKTECLWMNY
jgi:DNA adenine methylase